MQKILNKILDQGYYGFSHNSTKSSQHMCFAAEAAYNNGHISGQELHKLNKEVQKFLAELTGIPISSKGTLYAALHIKCQQALNLELVNLIPNSQLRKVQLAIYSDWANRQRIVDCLVQDLSQDILDISDQ